MAASLRGDNIRHEIREFILERFLPGTRAAELSDATPLVTGAILDSLATVQLVSWLEERFGIVIQAHETSVDYLNSVADIAQLVESKLA